MNRERALNDRAAGRRVDGTATSVRVIGKGNQERLAPLPEAFSAVFGFWLKDQPRDEYVFARTAGQKPVSSQAARAYLRGMLKQAGIEKKISPHPLRPTDATNLLNAGAERVTSRPCWGTPPSTPPRFTPTSGRSGWNRGWQGCESSCGFPALRGLSAAPLALTS